MAGADEDKGHRQRQHDRVIVVRHVHIGQAGGGVHEQHALHLAGGHGIEPPQAPGRSAQAGQNRQHCGQADQTAVHLSELSAAVNVASLQAQEMLSGLAAMMEAKGLAAPSLEAQKLQYTAPGEGGDVEVRNDRGQVQKAATNKLTPETTKPMTRDATSAT